MCTLSWWRDGRSFGVFFNRDESRKRLEAETVSRHEAGGVKYLGPLDTDGGGTWIWVNERGVIGCLLNNYLDLQTEPLNPVSRGLLLKSFASTGDSASLFKSLSRTDLTSYKGFQLFSMDEKGHGTAFWNGEYLQCFKNDTIRSPITSSGHLPEEIPRYRLNLYQQAFRENPSPSPRDLYSFHGAHDPDMPAHSVLMQRPDARTVSVSQVSIGSSKIRFTYSTVSSDCLVKELTTKTIHRADNLL